MEKLEYNESDKGFWMQYYVPFFSDVFRENRFEHLVFQMFSGLDVKAITTYVKKNEKEISNFRSFAGSYFDDIKLTRELHSSKRSSVKK